MRGAICWNKDLAERWTGWRDRANGRRRQARVGRPWNIPSAQLNRKMLLDLRDALRSFLTLLEGK